MEAKQGLLVQDLRTDGHLKIHTGICWKEKHSDLGTYVPLLKPPSVEALHSSTAHIFFVFSATFAPAAKAACISLVEGSWVSFCGRTYSIEANSMVVNMFGCVYHHVYLQHGQNLRFKSRRALSLSLLWYRVPARSGGLFLDWFLISEMQPCYWSCSFTGRKARGLCHHHHREKGKEIPRPVQFAVVVFGLPNMFSMDLGRTRTQGKGVPFSNRLETQQLLYFSECWCNLRNFYQHSVAPLLGLWLFEFFGFHSFTVADVTWLPIYAGRGDCSGSQGDFAWLLAASITRF